MCLLIIERNQKSIISFKKHTTTDLYSELYAITLLNNQVTMPGSLQPRLSSACEECRRRKARCDKSRPCCGNCSEAGKLCVFNDERAQRGPKRGQIRALRDRVNTLERLLAEQEHPVATLGNTLGLGVTEQLLDSTPDLTPDKIQSIWDFDTNFEMITEPFLTHAKGSPCLPTISPQGDFEICQSSDGSHISALWQDDVNLVYFERVHSNIPLIHKQRFFNMIQQGNLSKSQLCLQLAVQATATASTTQMLKLSDSLYTETCAALEAIEKEGPSSQAGGVHVELEYIQATLLMVYYEFLRKPQYKYILTVGRAFRLIQMAQLQDTDRDVKIPDNHISSEKFIRAEERRRALWLAYCFDRIFSIRHELPHTLHEEAIHARLPASEANFQNGEPTQMGFLSEVMADPETEVLPEFAECVVLATLRGRYVDLRRTSPTDAVWYYTKLDEIRACLWKRRQSLENHPDLTATDADHQPHAFGNILARSVMVDVYELAEGKSFEMHEDNVSTTIDLEQALEACNEIVRLAKRTVQLGRFKAPIFLPILLYRAIVFLVKHHPCGQFDGVEDMMYILSILSCVNHQAEELFHELGDLVRR
ncbi:fungal-specific transcription factor domain-containing protein [Nemania sp. FL0916]|nr:fungal-specific transcription factor domain-containing protein [Nemania sp. FL0916]